MPGCPPDARQPEADGGLVERIVAGDDSALGHVYDRHGSLVYGLARRVTGSTAAAERSRRRCSCSSGKQADRFDPSKGSLRVPGRHHPPAGGRLGAQRDPPAQSRDPHRTGRGDGHGHDAHRHHDRPVERGHRGSVRAAVETLPLEQREAVVLAYFGGLTFREVATTLGLPEGTAKSRLRLALAKLSNVLAAEGVTSWS